MNNTDTPISYETLIEKYDWIIKKNQYAILSPDIDGFLCGMFMSHYMRWKVIGFYDGKNLVITKGRNISDSIFLDMEIFNKDVRSIGQHMLTYNKNYIPHNFFNNFSQTINPNIIRNFDAVHDFKFKYPFATIHLLIMYNK